MKSAPAMITPFSANDSDPKRVTTNITVELSHSHSPPTLPFDLRDYVSQNTWTIRVSTLRRLASQFYRPTFERGYLFTILILSLVVPIVTYDFTFPALEHAFPNNVDKQIWVARSISFAAVVVTWLVLTIPVIVCKYVGKVRVTRLAQEWTKLDALAAPSYGAAPVWKAAVPGLFRDAVVLMVTIPSIKKSQFDRDSYLPPYIAAGDDALPPYRDSNMVNLSRDLEGGIKYGELPIYTDDKPYNVQV